MSGRYVAADRPLLSATADRVMGCNPARGPAHTSGGSDGASIAACIRGRPQDAVSATVAAARRPRTTRDATSGRLSRMVERARRRPPPPFEPARRPVESAQSRQARPASRRTDQRRLLAAALSSVAPGIGQLLNGRRRAAVIFGLPSLIIVILAWLTLQSDRPTMLLARIIAPSVLTALLVLNLQHARRKLL